MATKAKLTQILTVGEEKFDNLKGLYYALLPHIHTYIHTYIPFPFKA